MVIRNLGVNIEENIANPSVIVTIFFSDFFYEVWSEMVVQMFYLFNNCNFMNMNWNYFQVDFDINEDMIKLH